MIDVNQEQDDWDPRVPEFKFRLAVELISGGVNSACHPSEVGKNEYQLAGILCWRGDLSRIEPNSPRDCFGSTNALQSMVPNGWMEQDWFNCSSAAS